VKPIKHAQQHSYVDRLISLEQELNRLYEDMADHLSVEELDILDGDDPISNTHAAHECVQGAINGMKSFFVVQAGALAEVTNVAFDDAGGMSTAEFKEYFRSLAKKLNFGKVSIKSGDREVNLETYSGEMSGYFSSSFANGEITFAEAPNQEVIKELKAFLGGKGGKSKVKIRITTY
jgi:hypothetical protein